MIDISDDELVKMIVGAAFEVRKRLAQGYLESTYENAMIVELKMQGLEVENQVLMRVDYKGVEVGVFRADLLVEKRVIVEIKAVAQLNKIHEMQLVNYLQTTHIDNGVFSSFTFIKRLFSSSSLSAIRVVSSAYRRLLIFLLAILIPACVSSSPVFLMMYSCGLL